MTKIMALDFSKLQSEMHFNADICIVGSGVAGGILAKELRNAFPDYKIIVIESGNEDIKNAHNSDLKNTRSVNLPIKWSSRELMIGGTSNTWGGLVAKFLPHEINDRGGPERSGWGFNYEDLDYFYEKVIENYGFPSSDAAPPLDLISRNFLIRQFSADLMPLKFNIGDFESVDYVYNAHVTELRKCSDSTFQLTIQNLQTNCKSRVQSEYVFLAAGALESIRLLLNSQKENLIDLGTSSTLIGKYFMNHPRIKKGTVRLNPKNKDLLRPYIGEIDQRGRVKYFGLSLPAEFQRQFGYTNAYVRFEPKMPWDGDYVVYRAINLLAGFRKMVDKNLLRGSRLLSYAETGERDFSGLVLERNIFLSGWRFCLYLFYRVFKLRVKTDLYNVHTYLEMEPRLANSVSLSNDTDRFGKYLVEVDHSLSENDKISLVELHRKFSLFIRDKDIGAVSGLIDDVVDFPAISYDPAHHLGGLIMGDDPSNSVVDPYCEVNGINNLFVVSGAVFPYSGSHNPTLTIAALAARCVAMLKTKRQNC